MLRFVPLLLCSALSGCGSSPSGNANGSTVDPAVTSALADPLMTDPQLDRRSNADVLRPADEPYQAITPPGSPDPVRGTMPGDALPTAVARAKQAMADGPATAFTGCDLGIGYSYGWADRLSPEVALPAEAQVAEAAGSNTAKCQLRIVAYSAALASNTVLDSYRRVAKAGGYTSSEIQKAKATVLIATRNRDGAAFIVTVISAGSSSTVDLVSNRGR